MYSISSASDAVNCSKIGVWRHCVLVFLLRQTEGTALSLCESLRTSARVANYPHTPNPQQRLKLGVWSSSLSSLLSSTPRRLPPCPEWGCSAPYKNAKTPVIHSCDCRKKTVLYVKDHFLTAPTQDVIKAHRFLFFLLKLIFTDKIPGFSFFDRSRSDCDSDV